MIVGRLFLELHLLDDLDNFGDGEEVIVPPRGELLPRWRRWGWGRRSSWRWLGRGESTTLEPTVAKMTKLFFVFSFFVLDADGFWLPFNSSDE